MKVYRYCGIDNNFNTSCKIDFQTKCKFSRVKNENKIMLRLLNVGANWGGFSMAIRAIARYAAPYKAFFNALKCQQTAVLICRAQSCKTIVLKLFLHSVGFIHKNNWMQPESYFFQIYIYKEVYVQSLWYKSLFVLVYLRLFRKHLPFAKDKLFFITGS